MDTSYIFSAFFEQVINCTRRSIY